MQWWLKAADHANVDGPGTQDAGAVNVLYGSAGGLTGAGSQLLTQDTPGVPGTTGDRHNFGGPLAAADFNNNGAGDLAIGVPGQDSPGGAFVGAVNVLYGTGAGLDAAGSQLFSQDTPGVVDTAEELDQFSSWLAAGDFDHNASDDLAVGVPIESIGGPRNAGAVNVLFGSSGGLSGAGSQLLNQGSGGIAGVAEHDDSFGFAVSAGDYNANGFADLSIGASFEDVGAIGDAGAVNVLYGAGSGLAAPGNQQFWQGASGLAGLAEASDLFSSGLIGSDQ